MNKTCADCDLYLLSRKISDAYSAICLFHVVLQTLICIAGTVGNSLVLVVSLSNKPKQKKNADLTAIVVLAFVDLFVCMFLVPYEIHKANNYYTQLSSITCKTFEWIQASSLAMSCFVLLVVAVERCKCICSGQPQEFGYSKKLRYILLAVVTISAIVTCPTLVFKGIQTRPVDVYLLHRLGIYGYNESSFLVNISTVTACEYLDAYYNTWTLQVYGIIFIAIFIALIIITTICYGKIYFVLNGKPNVSRRKIIKVEPMKSKTTDDQKNKMAETLVQTRNACTTQTQRQEEKMAETLAQTQSASTKQTQRRQLHSESSIGDTEEVDLFYSSETKTDDTKISISFKKKTRDDRINGTNQVTGDPSYQFKSPNRRRQIFIAKILCLITGFFIVSWLPFWVINMCYLYIPDLDSRLNKVEVAVIHTLYHLYFLNNAINPVLYAIYSAQFRRHCKNIFQSFWLRVKRVFCSTK
ncbi:hypothetical protein SNE40_013591 [Patella caerulea]|uniref:G-protein coupled receptors family 1 profile domain-containing protein n=1 Tax=Patella caerulea TaxID=87958 RepID=A0AAN8JG91_PATCE